MTFDALPAPCFLSTAIVQNIVCGDGDIPFAGSFAVASRLAMCCPAFWSPSPSFLSCSLFSSLGILFRIKIGRLPFPLGCPRSRLRCWFREVDSAFHFRVDLLSFYSPVESDAYSRVLLNSSAFRDDVACLPWPLG